MKHHYLKTNDSQLRQMLAAATRCREVLDMVGYETIQDVWDMLYHGDRVHFPCSPERLFVVYERFPVLGDVRSGTRKSLLLRQLLDRSDETGVVVDSVRSGKDAMLLATLVKTGADVAGWINCMQETAIELTVIPIDNEDKVIIAPLSSFVHLRVSD